MAFKSQTKKIGTTTYTVTPLGAQAGRSILMLLMGKMGPAITEGQKNGGGAAFVGALVSAMDEPTVERLCNEFAPRTEVKLGDGKAPNLDAIFENHFAGNYGELLGWLQFCLEVNYSSFFVEAQRLVGWGSPKTPPATGKD